jgi:hypothetical protein
MRSKPRTTTSSTLLRQYREGPRRKRRQAQYDDRGSEDWSTPEEAAGNEAVTQGSQVTPSCENQQEKPKNNHKNSHNTLSAPQQRREKPFTTTNSPILALKMAASLKHLTTTQLRLVEEAGNRPA